MKIRNVVDQSRRCGASSALLPRRLAVALLVSLSFLSGGSEDTGIHVPELSHGDTPANQVTANSPAAVRLTGIPLYFIKNLGQSDAKVSFYAPGGGRVYYFTSSGFRLRLAQTGKRMSLSGPGVFDVRRIGNLVAEPPAAGTDPGVDIWDSVIAVEFEGANRGLYAEEGERAPAVVNYFKGAPDHWQTGVPTYRGIVYRSVWRGIDVEYTGDGSQMKSNFFVGPGADPSRIQLRYRGADSVQVSADGHLVVTTQSGEIQERRPYAYQEIAGKRVTVQVSYVLGAARPDGSVNTGFHLGGYDRRYTLIIDPVVLGYAGFVGGSADDIGSGVAADADGNAYIVGLTGSSSSTFPDKIGPNVTKAAGDDAFIAKVNRAGTDLIYAGYIGGSGSDAATGVAVDQARNAYVVGITNSTQASFPVTTGPDLTYGGGTTDAFIAKVNPAGTGLVYAGYIGGSQTDTATGVAVDSLGSAYVTGYTASTQTSFPVLGGPDLTFNSGSDDAFITKVRADGVGFVYSGFIGGAGADEGYGVAVDSLSNAYVTGATNSFHTTFPVVTGPDLTYNDAGVGDAFVSKINSAGTGFVYSGYIGGGAMDIGRSIAVDANGNAFVTGLTESSAATFPVQIGPDLSINGGADVFVAKVQTSGAGLVYAGYIGGSLAEEPQGIVVDEFGVAYVAGSTASNQATFPVSFGPDLTFNGGSSDAFIAAVGPAGALLNFSGFVGGSGSDAGLGLARSPSGSLFLVGRTNSTQTTFPVLTGPDVTANGGIDAYIARIEPTRRTKVGITNSGSWAIDRDGSTTWQGCATDLCFSFGSATTIMVVGDWDGDGDDDPGVFSNGLWGLDMNGNRIWDGCAIDRCAAYGTAGDIPVVGDWNGKVGDEIGVFKNGLWALDFNGNGVWDGCTVDHCPAFGSSESIPVVGDWDAMGGDEVGVFNNGLWALDQNGNGIWDGCGTDRCLAFGVAGNIPVVGNWTGTGPDKIGIFSNGAWAVDLNGNGNWDGCSTDRCIYFGVSGDLPVAGKWSTQ